MAAPDHTFFLSFAVAPCQTVQQKPWPGFADRLSTLEVKF